MQIEFLTSLPTIRFLEAKQDHQGLLVTAVGLGSTTCPDCGTPSTSRKGYYVRRLQDLPVQGRPVRVQVQVGRWRCRNILCARRSFAERLDSAALCYARRTRRLTELVCVLGHAAGGLPAERLLKRLGMPHSDDTVLRSVKRQAANRSAKVRVAGIDDWSQQRQGRSYGTIVVDLECRQVVEVLGDRSAESTAQWLRKHPEVEIVSRESLWPLCPRCAPRSTPSRADSRPFSPATELTRNLGASTRPVSSSHRNCLPDAFAPSADALLGGEERRFWLWPGIGSAETPVAESAESPGMVAGAIRAGEDVAG